VFLVRRSASVPLAVRRYASGTLTLPLSQIEALRDFVLQEGGGLLVTGGNRIFAKGGYYLSSLDPILLVSLEDRQQSRKTATAFSIVMDRSGSMAITTPSGHQKIQLAGEAVAECIRLMSPVDSVSVIPVDSAAHILIPQSDVTNPASMISEVLRIESMGGGIFVYTGLVAATSEIVKAKQLNKHVLLFADADSSATARPFADSNLADATGRALPSGMTPAATSARTASTPAPSPSEPQPDADASGMDYLSRSRDKSRRRFGKR
jgi:hypothetical protein